MTYPKYCNALRQDIIGLVPAGGKATRIAPIPCSKEIFPIGFGTIQDDSKLRPKAVAQYLLERIRHAGADRAYIILRSGKWDIPAYLGNGDLVGIRLGYLTTASTPGVPYTLDQAYPFIKRYRVAMGFPDILFEPEDAFVHLVNKQEQSNADIVLGLFPAAQSHKVDMVAINDDCKIREIQIKPTQTDLVYTWLIAVWSPRFTHFLHQNISNYARTNTFNSTTAAASANNEIFMGHVIQDAINEGLTVDSVIFSDGFYVDIGTREDMIAAMKHHFRIGGFDDHN
jgi:glucose-1-phosphate thymidylyltransferase